MFGLFKKKETRTPKMSGMMRSFAAAEVSRTLGAWMWDGGFSNQEIASSLATIRARARDMQKNNGDFKKYITLFKNNVVGHDGFLLRSLATVKMDDPTMDAEAKAFVEWSFARWAKNKRFADVTGVKTFAGICRLAAEIWARDGECFIWIDRHAQNRYGIALRIIRPDACPEWYQGTTSDGKWIRNGVEVEPSTYKPTAYYFDGSSEDNTAPIIWNGRTHHLRRIPAADIVHIYTQHDECQTRGIPLSHAGLKIGKMLDSFNEAELVAARDEANTIGIFHAPAGRDGEIAALNEDNEAVGKLTQESKAGQKLVLPEGWDYKTDTPQHPNREVTPFKATMKRDLANALDVEYANFANDWGGVTYSSVRAGTLAERDNWMTLQADFIDQCCTPVFEAWLDSWLRLAASGKYTVADYERLTEHDFRGRRWAWVDPLKDVNAAKVAVDNHWKTDAQIAAEYGADIDDNIEEAARIAALRKKSGLTAGQNIGTVNAE